MENIAVNGDIGEGYGSLHKALIEQIQVADSRFRSFNFSKEVFDRLIAPAVNNKLYKKIITNREVIKLFNRNSIKDVRIICATAEIFCTIINIFFNGIYKLSVIPDNGCRMEFPSSNSILIVQQENQHYNSNPVRHKTIMKLKVELGIRWPRR